jgi:hypothetical protein
MASTEQAVQVDGVNLMQFVFRAVGEVGGTLNAALMAMGDKLGPYRALAGAGPPAPAELAERTGTAERHVREWLNAQAAGSYVEYDPWLISEPRAGDRVGEDFNPVERAYYAFSTLLCTSASLSQDVGLALGAQVGEARIRDVVATAGSTRFRRVVETPLNVVYVETPLNVVYEARP